MDQTYSISVYDGSTLVSVIEATPKTAWDAAVAAVRSMAHSAGFSGPALWEQSKDRVSYAIGPFRAVTTRRGRS